MIRKEVLLCRVSRHVAGTIDRCGGTRSNVRCRRPSRRRWTWFAFQVGHLNVCLRSHDDKDACVFSQAGCFASSGNEQDVFA